ncbi:MAG: ABC transporter permease [Treponema sp.]|nr:ABC transporter permease [Treponema sp.]
MKISRTPVQAALLTVPLALLAVPLAVLVVLRIGERRGNPPNLFLVSPLEDFVFDRQKLERLNGEGLLVTYEVRRRIRASTGFAACPLTVIGTNSLYPRLIPCPPEWGSFFTAAAENAKNRHAVLNRTAAARLFGALPAGGGSVRMEGELWLVCGVVNDGEDESPRIYVPASIRGEGPRSLLVWSGDQARVENALKSLGAANHRLFDLSQARGLRLGIALRLLLCALSAVFARRCLRDSRTVPRTPARSPGGTVRFFARRIPGLALLCALCLHLARWILEACLRLRDLPSPQRVVSSVEFPALLTTLRTHDRAEFAAFVLFLAALAVLTACYGAFVWRGISRCPGWPRKFYRIRQR